MERNTRQERILLEVEEIENGNTWEATKMAIPQIPMIEISGDLANNLTHESILDRFPKSINMLIIDGKAQEQRVIEAKFG